MSASASFFAALRPAGPPPTIATVGFSNFTCSLIGLSLTLLEQRFRPGPAIERLTASVHYPCSSAQPLHAPRWDDRLHCVANLSLAHALAKADNFSVGRVVSDF